MQKQLSISSLLSQKKNEEAPSPRKKVALTKQNFEVISKLGRGAYGHVYLVKKDNVFYAMKQIEKRKLARQKKEYQALIQKQLLSKMKHPGIVKLIYSFQDKQILYFILEYCKGGCFKEFIKLNYQSFTLQLKVFYIAQLVNILEYLHNNGITHRDLKPENIMLSKDSHLKLIDFGTAQITNCTIISQEFKDKINLQKKPKENQVQQKQLVLPLLLTRQMSQSEFEESPRKRNRRSTFVGTSYYISPELLEFNICEAPSDLWALGCIIYQIFYLDTPFGNTSEYQIFEKIKVAHVEFPKNDTITIQAIDLIKRLLVKNPQQRLGSNSRPQLSYKKLKQHPFFAGVNFETIFEQPVPQYKEPQITEQQIYNNIKKVERSKTEMLKILKQELEKDEKKILIHGILSKKTLLHYELYYFIIYKDLSVKKIKYEDNQRVKFFQIKYQLVKDKNTPNTNQTNQSINNTLLLAAKPLNNNKFQILTQQKIYILKAENQDQVDRWVNAINSQAQVLKQTLQIHSSDSD